MYIIYSDKIDSFVKNMKLLFHCFKFESLDVVGVVNLREMTKSLLSSVFDVTTQRLDHKNSASLFLSCFPALVTFSFRRPTCGVVFVFVQWRI